MKLLVVNLKRYNTDSFLATLAKPNLTVNQQIIIII